MPEGDTVYRTAQRLERCACRRRGHALRAARAAGGDGRPARHDRARGRLARQAPAAPHRRVDAALAPQDGGRVARLPPGEPVAAAGVQGARGGRATAEWETVGFDLADIKVVPTARRGAARRPPRSRPAVARTGIPTRPPAASAPTTRAVHVALQDQRNVAGFGNEYANEILFVRGILPTTPATETDAAAIVDLGARMIRANRDRVEPHVHRRRPSRPLDLGVRAGGPALPPVRHPHPRRLARRRPDPRAQRRSGARPARR